MTLTHSISDTAPASAELDRLTEVRAWVRGTAEPFTGARAALDGPEVTVVTTGRLGSPNTSFDVYSTVRLLSTRNGADGGGRSLVAVLEGPLVASERALEDRLWHTLQHLNDFDDGPWDDTVVRALDLADHAFVVGGDTWSVELLHPQSPRAARRSPWPVLVVRPLPTG